MRYALILLAVLTRFAWAQPAVIQVNEQNSLRVVITGFTLDDAKTLLTHTDSSFRGVDVTLDFTTNPVQRLYAKHFDPAATEWSGASTLTFTIPSTNINMRPGPPQKAVLTYRWWWVDPAGVTQQGKKEDTITLVNLSID